MNTSPIKLPNTSLSPSVAPSPDKEEERDKGGTDKSPSQAVYLADLNVCYYQQCFTKTVCQEDNNESKLLLRQNLKQRQEGLYELQILIQIDNKLIELNHYFCKSLDISKQITPLSQATLNTKKVSRIRPSCVQNAIQQVGVTSPTTSPNFIQEKQTMSQQYEGDILNNNSISIQEKQISFEGISLTDVKTNRFHSQDQRFLLCQQEEDLLENTNLLSHKQQYSLSEIQKSTGLISTSIGTEQEINLQSEYQIESKNLILHSNSQVEQTRLQPEIFQQKRSSEEQNKDPLEIHQENLTFSSSFQSMPLFDLTLIKENSEQNVSSKKNSSNNLVKNILVGFKTSLTNPRSKIYQDIHNDIKSLKGEKYSDFKKKFKQFFKKPRTNLSDIISIFNSQQKKDVFKLFIERYSNSWLDSSPIQDKDNIRRFLDFLLICYQQPDKIQVLNPYRRNKQRNLYRITDSDVESQEIQVQQDQNYFHQMEESQNEKTNSQNQITHNLKENIKDIECEFENLQTNKIAISKKNRSLNKENNKKSQQKFQFEEEAIDEEPSVQDSQIDKSIESSNKILKKYSEETSEIQSFHQLSPNDLPKGNMLKMSQSILIQFQFVNIFIINIIKYSKQYSRHILIISLKEIFIQICYK